MSEISTGAHRCYGALAVQHLLVSAVAGLPVPIAARVAAVASTGGPGQVNTALLHVDPAQSLLAAALVAAGVTSWALLDHLAAHLFAAVNAAAQTDAADPDQPRQAV